ncbi:MAG: TetR/AcrR family transcriptional regulator [Streptosporangiales bacterium]
MAPVTKRRQRGPNDPGRRDRIARAAVAVIAEHGIDSLTHRKVATKADVALGSTTYYFASLENLLAAALDKAAEAGIAELQAWADGLGDEEDLAPALADFVIESVSERRKETLAEYNLYVLAFHRPHLRSAVVRWDDALSGVLIKLTDTPTGRMLGTLLCGLLMQVVLHDDVPTKADVTEIFRRAIAGSSVDSRTQKV